MKYQHDDFTLPAEDLAHIDPVANAEAEYQYALQQYGPDDQATQFWLDVKAEAERITQPTQEEAHTMQTTTTTTQNTVNRFINRHGITSTAEWTDKNPNMDDNHSMTHWKVTLRRVNPRRQMTVTFSMGSAHRGNPKTADVLNCLLMDAQGLEYAATFEEWADEYGYDTDSRKAERTYNAVKRQTHALRTFLDDQWEEAQALDLD